MSRTQSTAVNRVIEQVIPQIDNNALRILTTNCLANTLETTVQWHSGEDPFVITGDIPAMWLRDSSCQLEPYIRFTAEDAYLQRLIQGTIMRQVHYILTDHYANAFNRTSNGVEGFPQDKTQKNPWVYERKFELDSLCHPIRLWFTYFSTTHDHSIFSDDLHGALQRIIELCEIEQDHERSFYRFERDNAPLTDTLTNGGFGTPVGITGMVWSGFRPSDDACVYHYLIPAQMFLTVAMAYATELLEVGYKDETLADRAQNVARRVGQGIEHYGLTEIPDIGRVWAYEVDGLGNSLVMDDANVPSLLSLPYLGYCAIDDPMYLRTRAAILSHHNPYFFRGRFAEGIGSPHTPHGFVWPIAITMQALTSESESEIERCIEMLVGTDAGTGFMHESLHPDHPEQFSRPWFAWANSLFAELMLRRMGFPVVNTSDFVNVQ